MLSFSCISTAMHIELEFSDDDEGSVGAMEFEDSQSQPTSSLESADPEEYLEFDDDGDYDCPTIDDVLKQAPLAEEEEEEGDSDVDMTEDPEEESRDTE